MKALAFVAITILVLLALAQPAAARPRDPEGRRPPACQQQPTFGDPFPWRCRSGLFD